MKTTNKLKFELAINNPSMPGKDGLIFEPTDTGWNITYNTHPISTLCDGLSDVEIVDLSDDDGATCYSIGGLPKQFANSNVHAPDSVRHFLETIWQELSDKRMTPEDAQQAFEELATWIDATTAAFPEGRMLDRLK